MKPKPERWSREKLDLALGDLLGMNLHDPVHDPLTESEMPELEALEIEDLEYAIASIHQSQVVPEKETVPEALMETIRAQAKQWVAKQDVENPQSAATPEPAQSPAWTRLWQLGGWAAAAVLLGLFWLHGRSTPQKPADTGAQLAQLEATATDLVRVPWTEGEDPASVGVSGQVVWSDASQTGFMVFQGLPVNQPSQAQYQLWVFDPSRADWQALPVDGGVFDITKSGRSVIPIDVKLPVQAPTLWAITIEKPGGVVVSKRERLVLTASPS